uniref:Uncharacterized protein n=1 Tax=Tetranychus urticae TaxID=32264 RepID=T1JYS8_TETUR
MIKSNSELCFRFNEDLVDKIEEIEEHFPLFFAGLKCFDCLYRVKCR